MGKGVGEEDMPTFPEGLPNLLDIITVIKLQIYQTNWLPGN